MKTAVATPPPAHAAHLDGWKAIGLYVGRSERWCRYMSKRDPRPLPVGYVGGRIRMLISAYEEWLAAEMGGERPPPAGYSGRAH